MGAASCRPLEPSPENEEEGVNVSNLIQDCCQEEIAGASPKKAPVDPAKAVLKVEKTSTESAGTASTLVFDPDEDGVGKPSWSIHIDKHYDYYCPSTGKRSKLRIPAEVVHSRHTRAGRMSRQTSGSSSSSAASDSTSLQSLSSRGSQAVTDLSFRLSRADEVEVLARWALLAGKVLYNKVMALTSVSSMVLDRVRVARRLQGAFIESLLEGRGKGLKMSVDRIALEVVQKAKSLAQRIRKEPADCYDADWHAEFLSNSASDEILSFLFTRNYADTIMVLAKAAMKLLASQPTLVEASAPCRVVGDIHGQLRDLLLLLFSFVMPGDRIIGSSKAALRGGAPMSYVFNGDFVDRGQHQLETIGLLLALKVAFPGQVWLIRGNHEDRTMNERYGFEDECIHHLGEEMGYKIYSVLEDAFDFLPIACLVEEHVLVLHGGIGKGDWDLNDLRVVERPLRSEDLAKERNKWLRNILWSDPIPDDADDDLDDSDGRSECPSEVFGVHASPRNHYSVRFGWDVTSGFCARNGLGLVVRSHQCVRDELGFSIMHDNFLVRVFSARDYEAMDNDSSTLLISHRVPSDPRGGSVVPNSPVPSVASGSVDSSAIDLPSLFETKHLNVRAQVLASCKKTGGA